MAIKELTQRLLVGANGRPVNSEGTPLLELASEANGAPVELYKNDEMIRRLDVQNWLPMASEQYEISSDIQDFVVVPVIIAPTDLPNRNSVAFPMEELMKFNVRQGRPNYKTWVGKATYEEHANHDFTKSKGIIFDTFLKPIEGARGGVHKLIALSGFDRTKDPELARAILKGERASYSMGAFITTYQCSVCGDCSRPGRLNTECGHVVRGRPEMHPMPGGAKRPSYLIARQGIEGFEVSSVGRPAWVSAVNSQFFDMAR